MKPNSIQIIFIALVISGYSPAGTQEKTEKTRATIRQEMILIPGGSFIMGKTPVNNAGYIDNTAHEVKVSGFFLDKYEVSNSMYLEFCEETGHALPEFWGMDEFYSGPEFPDHPVVGVTWADACKYAEWADKRLPTEAEWEFAARGGLIQKNFPNGDDVDSSLVNYYGTYGHALAVGSLPPNGFGLHDMAGNVTEWVSDFYGKDYYLESAGENPTGPVMGNQRVIRGGGWRSGKGCTSCWFRQSLRPYWVDMNVGFRCARDFDE